MLETRQPDRLAAGERLGMADADGVAPEPGPVADRVDHARLPLGLVINELRAVAAQGRDLGVELIGDVDQEVRAFYDLQVDAEVIQDPRDGTGCRACRSSTACSRTGRPRPGGSRRHGRGGHPPSRARRAGGAGPCGRQRPARGGGPALAPGSGSAGRGSGARGLRARRWPRRSPPPDARASPTALARRSSGRGCRPATPGRSGGRSSHPGPARRRRGATQRPGHPESGRRRAPSGLASWMVEGALADAPSLGERSGIGSHTTRVVETSDSTMRGEGPPALIRSHETPVIHSTTRVAERTAANVCQRTSRIIIRPMLVGCLLS